MCRILYLPKMAERAFHEALRGESERTIEPKFSGTAIASSFLSASA